jgi:glycerophosphoryl diester phosphodiesterase
MRWCTARVALALLLCACGTNSGKGASAVSNGVLADDLRLPITSCFRFQGPNPFAAAYGPAQLSPFDRESGGWTTTGIELGTTDQLALPPLPDGPAAVMHVPVLKRFQGLLLRHGTAANGDFSMDGEVARYTLVFDVFYPPASAGHFRPLYQTDAENKNDADFFVSDTGGIGVSGLYQGNVDDGRWHRIVVVVRADGVMGQMQKYIDGMFVGAQGEVGAAIDSRWALDPKLILFSDNTGEGGDVYVSSVMFIGEALLMDEVRQLGGPTANGACVPGAPGGPDPVKLSRPAGVFGHKGAACCAPEHTLAAITQALDDGAEFIEVDLQFTSDDVAVALHDDRVDRTTNSSGDVDELSLAKVQSLDAGSWFHPKFAGEHIPSLGEILRVTKGRARVYLDGVGSKGPAIVAAMQEAGVGPEAIWPWAQSSEEIDYLRDAIPGVQILYSGTSGWNKPGFFESLAQRQVTGFSIPWQDLTPEFAAAAHAHGMYVEVYTVFDPDRMRAVIADGADGMETDYTAVLKELEPPILTTPSGLIRLW